SVLAATRFEVSCAEAAEQRNAKTHAAEEITDFNIRYAFINFAGHPVGAEISSGRRSGLLVSGT
ncbi:hypothetical protein N9747_05925, partial [Planktomarina sp.]|nr:hypothetical protein [Planktomarina sp.]